MASQAKTILIEDQQWYDLTHRWEDKAVHGISPKVKHNSVTGVWTRLLWDYNPTL